MTNGDTERIERAYRAIQAQKERIAQLEAAHRAPIAIVGQACRFPGADGPDELDVLLQNAVDAIATVPPGRWGSDGSGNAQADVAVGGFVDGIDAFDSLFFGISPREAARLDPQHGVLLEMGWSALEDAGIDPQSLQGTRTAVFVGMCEGDHARSSVHYGPAPDIQSVTGAACSVASGRLSYFLGVHGPSMPIDTACSSSLVAIHLAVGSLRSGESELALAGGVSAILAPDTTLAFKAAGALAADGRCKAFDARADGFVRSEGCGIVVLKRLADAQRDGNRVIAVILGSAVNQDGRTNGLMSPNGAAQQAVIRKALEDAGIGPEDVGYVEAHGTGTALGDPIEIAALAQVFAHRRFPLPVGTIKTNMGHLEAAAGIAGLMKAVHVVAQGVIPRNLHFNTPSPYVDWNDIPLVIPAAEMELVGPRRIAGVSSFGFSGTNAHVIVAQPPPGAPRSPADDESAQLVKFSAKTASALRRVAGQHAAFLERRRGLDVADYCHTANLGRADLRHRACVIGADADQLASELRAIRDERSSAGYVAGQAAGDLRTAFLFSGQGAQHAGMGRELFATYPTFRETLIRCDEILRDELERPLLAVLYPAEDSSDAGLIDTTAYAQPALFAFEYALFELWRSFGVEPYALIGHSSGEYAAACAGGCFSLEDGLAMVARRAALVQSATKGGATAALFAPVEPVAAALQGRFGSIGIAGVNAPRETLIAGLAQEVEAALVLLKEAGISGRKLNIPYAPHSPLVAPILDEFFRFLATIDFSASRRMLISNVTGDVLEKVDPRYWCRHLLEPVRFAAGMRRIEDLGCNALLEIGPQPVLQLLGRQNWRGKNAYWLPSLWKGCDERRQILECAGAFYAHGGTLNWETVNRRSGRSISIPTYPFEHNVRPAGTVGLAADVAHSGEPADENRAGSIARRLRELLESRLEIDAAAIQPGTSFLELGADSLLLAKISLDIEDRYGVRIGIGELFETYDTAERVADFVDRSLSRQPSRAASRHEALSPEGFKDAAVPVTPPTRQDGRSTSALAQPHDQRSPCQTHDATAETGGPPILSVASAAPRIEIPRTGLTEARPPDRSERSLLPRQRDHLRALVDRFATKTPSSGKRFAINRRQRVDTRMTRLLRPELRDVLYPVIGDRAEGARIWDIDGNPYVDITMGIGVLLCGHSPDFIQSAMAEQLAKKIQNGPVANLADAVAALIAEMTGHERVLFGLSGTASVSNALRVARAATGRQKFVMFSGSYHGSSDQTLAIPELGRDPTCSTPMTPGVSENGIRDAIVLPYATAASLETIRNLADKLAAVLVEPVQSRNPALQPKEFLAELRRLTAERGVPLIFDEVMTGFRAHAGGAQAIFGIVPDLAVYGKCIGGGLPVSAVAGRASLLDCVDLGMTRAFDRPTTFVGSTFDMHPLCLAASHAMLTHLKQTGGALQEGLNAEVARLAGSLNAFFAAEAVPLTITYFGSMFRFAWKGNTSYVYQPLDMDIFHLHLVEKGLYIWEGRTCFLSTAHDADDRRVIEAVVRETVAEMKAGGFLCDRAPPARAAAQPERHAEMTAQQRRLLRMKREQPPDAPDWCIVEHVSLDGVLDMRALEAAAQALVARHDALRSVFPLDGSARTIQARSHPNVRFEEGSKADSDGRRRAVHVAALAEAATPFDLEVGPLLRIRVLRTGGQECHLIVCCHHIVGDGWSMAIILEELGRLYAREVGGSPAALDEVLQFGDYVRRQAGLRGSPEWQEAQSHWQAVFREPVGDLVLPFVDDATPGPASIGDRLSGRLDSELVAALGRFSRERRLTPFMALFGVFALHLHALSGQDRLVCGTPVAARFFPGSERIVGYCAHFLPIVSMISPGMSVSDYFSCQSQAIIAALRHQNMPFEDMLMAVSGTAATDALPFAAVFNMDPPMAPLHFGDLAAQAHPVPSCFALVDYRLDVMQVGQEYWLDYDYRRCRFGAATVREWHERFERLLRGILSADDREVGALLSTLADPQAAAARLSPMGHVDIEVHRDRNCLVRRIGER